MAIARELYKKPILLLLDEATSALDRMTAHRALDVIQLNKPAECIVLMVSHTPELKKHFDLVFELKEGRLQIVEQGYE